MKNPPWYITVAAVIALIFVLLKNCNDPAPEIGYVKDSTQYWRNREGKLIASLKQREIDFAVAQKGWIDSIAKLHNTTAKRIKEIISATVKGQATIKGEGKPTIIYRKDTTGVYPEIRSMSQIFLSPYLFANVRLHAMQDSSTLDITTYDTVTTVVKEVREGNVFNRKWYTQVDMKNANPNNVITGISGFRLPEARPKKFGIGIQAGYGFSNSLQPNVYIGIGVSYNLIRL
jgi:hypothetical protein